MFVISKNEINKIYSLFETFSLVCIVKRQMLYKHDEYKQLFIF